MLMQLCKAPAKAQLLEQVGGDLTKFKNVVINNNIKVIIKTFFNTKRYLQELSEWSLLDVDDILEDYTEEELKALHFQICKDAILQII